MSTDAEIIAKLEAEVERLRKELSYRVHTEADIQAQNKEIERLRVIAAAAPTPAQLLELQTENEQLHEDKARAALIGRKGGPKLPKFRCDNCDNGIETDWDFCAWCGVALTGGKERPARHA